MVYLSRNEIAELDEYCKERLGLSRSTAVRIAILEVVRAARGKRRGVPA